MLGALRALQAFKTAGAAESIGTAVGRGVRKSVGFGSRLGGALAKGLGGDEEVGRLLGGGAVIGAGLGVGNEAKLRWDAARWRAMNGGYQ